MDFRFDACKNLKIFFPPSAAKIPVCEMEQWSPEHQALPTRKSVRFQTWYTPGLDWHWLPQCDYWWIRTIHYGWPGRPSVLWGVLHWGSLENNTYRSDTNRIWLARTRNNDFWQISGSCWVVGNGDSFIAMFANKPLQDVSLSGIALTWTTMTLECTFLEILYFYKDMAKKRYDNPSPSVVARICNAKQHYHCVRPYGVGWALSQ